MNVVYATDINYVPIMGTSICSLFENNKECEQINVFILEDNIGDFEKEKLILFAKKYGRNIFFYSVNNLIQKFERSGMTKYNGSYACYIRLYVGELLQDIDKCLYLDCDTLIMGTLNNLYSLDLEKFHVGLAIDCNHNDANKAIKKSCEAKYFNSGVMLINLKRWRDDKLFDKFLCASKEIDLSKTLTNSDQELINYLLDKSILTISLKYNLGSYFRIRAKQNLRWIIQKNEKAFYSSEEIMEANRNPIILHFTGGSWGRPWFSNSIDAECGVWEKYLRLSPWSDYVMQYQKTTLWRKVCIWSEKYMPVWLFCLIKRYEAKYMVRRKCG